MSLPEGPWVVPSLPPPSALQLNRQLKVVLVRQIQSRLQARASFLHSELFPSALQLHPHLKKRFFQRSVVPSEQQREVCSGHLPNLSGLEGLAQEV